MPSREAAPQRATAADARRRARELFLDGARIDMQALAGEMGIGRATLYRWVGDRDALIASAIWSISGPALEQLAIDTKHLQGPQRILAVVERMGRDLLTWMPYQAFLDREPTAALRILTTPATDIQERTMRFLAGVLREEREAKQLRVPDHVATDVLAYAILRLAESFFYADIVAGRAPDVDEALSVIQLLVPA